MLGVYAVIAVEAFEAATDCGELFRCASKATCDMALGAYVDVDAIGRDPTPAVDE